MIGGHGVRLGFFYPVFEAFEHGPRVIGRLAQGIKNAVSHFDGCLKRFFLAAVLAVGKIFGKLIPLAADAQSPALEGCGFVCVAGNVTLGHGCVYVFRLRGPMRSRAPVRYIKCQIYHLLAI